MEFLSANLLKGYTKLKKSGVRSCRLLKETILPLQHQSCHLLSGLCPVCSWERVILVLPIFYSHLEIWGGFMKLNYGLRAVPFDYKVKYCAATLWLSVIWIHPWNANGIGRGIHCIVHTDLKTKYDNSVSEVYWNQSSGHNPSFIFCACLYQQMPLIASYFCRLFKKVARELWSPFGIRWIKGAQHCYDTSWQGT